MFHKSLHCGWMGRRCPGRFGLFLTGIGLILLMVFFQMVACSGDDDDDDATPTATPTLTPTPTVTMTPTATPTATPVAGWGTEVAAAPKGEWLHLDSNSAGELCLAYIRPSYVGYVTRDTSDNWSTETIVPGSENNLETQRFYIRSQIDDEGDVHFAWTGPGVPWRLVFYNSYSKASATWSGALDVIWGYDYTHTPSLMVQSNPVRKFVTGQIKWGIGFNWDYGQGWNTELNIPLWDDSETHEPKQPRLAIGQNDNVYLVIYDYFGHDNKDQIGFNEFNTTTNTWSGWIAPSPEPYGAYPGFPAIYAADDGSVHVLYYVWHSGTEYDELVYVKRNADGSWNPKEVLLSEPLMMTEDVGAAFPCIAVNSDGVIMVINNILNASEEKIYYTLKRPGSSWEGFNNVTSSAGQFFPSLTVSGNTFILAWLDDRDAIYVNEYNP